MYVPGHIQDFDNKPIEDIIKERNSVLKKIYHFENKYILNTLKPDNIFDIKCVDPSPEVLYQCDNEYLVQLTELLNKKFNEKVWNGEKWWK
ncbi:MAG: hypothetical protein PHX40_03325 [Bacilli bacterium]|nr:hypothetical protein [Bacilli bacterium]